MNTRFSTGASYWIKQSMKRRHQYRQNHPHPYERSWSSKRRATAKLQEALGRTPTQEEIGASLSLSKKKLAIIRKGIRIYNAVPQTESPETGRPIEEMLMDDESEAPDSNLPSDDLKQVMDLLGEMDKREAAVLRLRFGLDGDEPMTLKEIGDRLGLTRERVRQIEVLAQEDVRIDAGSVRRAGERKADRPSAQFSPAALSSQTTRSVSEEPRGKLPNFKYNG